MGKLTNKWPFLVAMLVYQRVPEKLLLSVALLSSSLSLLLPPCLLALAPCFLLLSASLSLALTVCCHHFLPLAACNVFSDALPLLQAGSADLYTAYIPAYLPTYLIYLTYLTYLTYLI
jgi:hypothetical protein